MPGVAPPRHPLIRSLSERTRRGLSRNGVSGPDGKPFGVENTSETRRVGVPEAPKGGRSA